MIALVFLVSWTLCGILGGWLFLEFMKKEFKTVHKADYWFASIWGFAGPFSVVVSLWLHLVFWRNVK